MDFNPEIFKIDNLCEYFKNINKLKIGKIGWIFRGCKINDNIETLYCHLVQIFKTTFDDFIEKWDNIYKCKGENKDVDRRCLEVEIIRDFQRRFSISESSDRPPDNDLLSWLALMRHHGAPTRLLDFSYSPYMPLFFAFDSMFKSCAEKCVVLAIKSNWFDKIKIIDKKSMKKIDGNKIEAFISFFYKPNSRSTKNLINFVYPVNPYDLNPRMASQGGLFLCPSNIDKTCFENFKLMNIKIDKENFKLFIFEKKMTEEVFKELYKMNISDASVYPGMDGYAKSFWKRYPTLSKISGEHKWPFYKQFFFDRLIKQ